MLASNKPTVQTLNIERSADRRQKTILVLGVGRGGTSATAGVLRELGVAFPHAHPLKHEWSPLSVGADGELDLRTTIARLDDINTHHDVWGWKSPGDGFRLERFQHHVRNPFLVIVFRNFLDICTSGARNDGFPWEVVAPTNSAVVKRLADIIAFSGLPIVAFAYETLIANASAVIHQINDLLGLEASTERLEAATAFVQSRKYNKVSFDNNAGLFSDMELAADAERSQSVRYLWINECLDEKIAAMRGWLQTTIAHAAALEADLHGRRIHSDRADAIAALDLGAADLASMAGSDADRQHLSASELAESYRSKRILHQNLYRTQMELQKRLELLQFDLAVLETPVTTTRGARKSPSSRNYFNRIGRNETMLMHIDTFNGTLVRDQLALPLAVQDEGLELIGWARPARAETGFSQINFQIIQDETAHEGQCLLRTRPDVAASANNPNLTRCGFHLRLKPHGVKKGRYGFRLVGILPNGRKIHGKEFALAID